MKWPGVGRRADSRHAGELGDVLRRLLQLRGAGGEAEYRRWLSEAGYRSVEVVDLARPPESMIFAAM